MSSYRAGERRPRLQPQLSTVSTGTGVEFRELAEARLQDQQDGVERLYRLLDREERGYLVGHQLRDLMVSLGMRVDQGRAARLFHLIGM